MKIRCSKPLIILVLFSPVILIVDFTKPTFPQASSLFFLFLFLLSNFTYFFDAQRSEPFLCDSNRAIALPISLFTFSACCILRCLVCIVVILCVFPVLCVYCSFYFRCRTAGQKSVFGRSCDRPPRHRFFSVSLCL